MANEPTFAGTYREPKPTLYSELLLCYNLHEQLKNSFETHESPSTPIFLPQCENKKYQKYWKYLRTEKARRKQNGIRNAIP